MPSFFEVSADGIVRTCLAVALCLLSVTACSRSARPGTDSASPASVALVLLHGVNRDIGVSKSMEAIWITDEKQWNALPAPFPLGMLEILPQPVAVPDVDFTKYGVLLIRLGEKPNGGYGLKLTADAARIENREAQIPVHLSEPEPGFLYTQAIIYPHLAIIIEKGSFDSIAVVDQNGIVILRLPV